MRRIAIVLTLLIAAGGVLWFAGPRVAKDTTISFDEASIGEDVEAWLAASEAKVPGIRDGLAKEIVWAYPASRARTPLAVVYVHGFSASKGETHPVAEHVAATLRANLFLTRLTGHGRDGAAMAKASVNDWINDYAEAIAVGERLGEKVVVIAASTGASIAAWAATQPHFRDRVAALALVSPNFGVRAGSVDLLAGPWGRQLARLLIGAERGFEPQSDLQRHYWTYRYPAEAILPMAGIVTLAAEAPFEKATTPVLFVFSDEDAVVRPDLTRAVAGRWGAARELLVLKRSDDPSNHVIAGDAFSPSTTEETAQAIATWLGSLDL